MYFIERLSSSWRLKTHHLQASQAQEQTFFFHKTPLPESVGLFLSTDQLYDGKELLMTFVSFLFLQHQHEVVVETALHHDPVHSPGQVDVRGQKHNVFTAECRYGLVRREKVV